MLLDEVVLTVVDDVLTVEVLDVSVVDEDVEIDVLEDV